MRQILAAVESLGLQRRYGQRVLASTQHLDIFRLHDE